MRRLPRRPRLVRGRHVRRRHHGRRRRERLLPLLLERPLPTSPLLPRKLLTEMRPGPTPLTGTFLTGVRAGAAVLAGVYCFNEIGNDPRAGPPRLLGLRHKGHLGVGADADVTVYSRDPDIATMFSTPRYVVKAGRVVVEEGFLRRAPAGRRLRLAPGFDDAVLRDLRKHFEAYSTVSFDNYPVRELPDEPMALGGKA